MADLNAEHVNSLHGGKLQLCNIFMPAKTLTRGNVHEAQQHEPNSPAIQRVNLKEEEYFVTYKIFSELAICASNPHLCISKQKEKRGSTGGPSGHLCWPISCDAEQACLKQDGLDRLEFACRESGVGD